MYKAWILCNKKTQYAIGEQTQSIYSIPSLACDIGYALEPAPINNTSYVAWLGCQHVLKLYELSDMQARRTPTQTLVRSCVVSKCFRRHWRLSSHGDACHALWYMRMFMRICMHMHCHFCGACACACTCSNICIWQYAHT